MKQSLVGTEIIVGVKVMLLPFEKCGQCGSMFPVCERQSPTSLLSKGEGVKTGHQAEFSGVFFLLTASSS